jgi:hypothetical protein
MILNIHSKEFDELKYINSKLIREKVDKIKEHCKDHYVLAELDNIVNELDVLVNDNLRFNMIDTCSYMGEEYSTYRPYKIKKEE